jgi:competence ComEA-like helix-hairpin-helix protein
VGPRRAQAIVEWRGLHGPFATVHDLARVPHLGERVASKIWQEVHRSDP